jgi:hypothetical protein
MVENREATMEELAAMMGVGYGSVFRLIHALGANKVASVWAPNELTEDQRALRANIALDYYLSWTDDNSILDRIIAIDETWLKSLKMHRVSGVSLMKIRKYKKLIVSMFQTNANTFYFYHTSTSTNKRRTQDDNDPCFTPQ